MAVVVVAVLLVVVAVPSDALGNGGVPRRDKLVTEYPSSKARLQIVPPRKPVPPNTNNRLFLFGLDDTAVDVAVSSSTSSDDIHRTDDSETEGRANLVVAAAFVV